MGCCGGGGSTSARGRRVYFVVFDNFGNEDSSYILLSDARARQAAIGSHAPIQNIKRFFVPNQD